MKANFALSGLLLAGSAIASPTRRDLRGRTLKGPGRPLAVGHTSLKDNIVIPQTSEVTYDSNWAGAIQIGTDITSVTGEFTVPKVTTPSSGSSSTEYGAAAWVGIDGDTCTTAILQTGISFITEDDKTTYAGWYEWYPHPSVNFADFSVAEGDVIKATVKASSKTSGTATLENVTSGKTVSHTFGNETAKLCLENAEWIVEDFESGSSLIAFADFGKVAFTGASYTHDGSTDGVSGATIVDVKQDSKVLTSCSTSGDSSLTCTYE